MYLIPYFENLHEDIYDSNDFYVSLPTETFNKTQQ